VSDPTLLAVEGLLGVAAIAGVGAWAASGRHDDPVTAEVRFPADLTAAQVEALLAHVASLAPGATVRYTAESTVDGLSFSLSAAYGPFHSLTAALSGIAPEVRIDETDAAIASFSRGVRLFWRGAWPLLRTDQPESAVAGLLGSCSGLRSGERLRLVVALRPAGRVRRPSETTNAPPDVLQQRFGLGERRLSAHELRAIRTKLASPLLRVRLVIAAESKSPGRADHLIGRVCAAIRSRTADRGGPVTRRLTSDRLQRELSCATAQGLRLGRWGAVLNPSELIPLVAWPIAAPRLPGLAYGTAPRLMPSAHIPSRGRGRVFGLSDWPGVDARPLVQPTPGAATHSLILGPTGVGKSTLVTGLALQQAQAGEGLVFLDLKGDAADELLSQLAVARHDDVIVLDPSAGLPVPGLKTFGHGDPELAADLLLGTFRGLFASTFGVFSAQYLRLGLLTLAGDPAATLGDLEPLFTNAAFRRRIVGGVTDRRLRASWAAFDDLSAAQQAERLASPLRKIGALLGRSVIRGVVAQQQPRFDLGDVLRRGRLVVVSLSPGRLGSEATRLLAALLLWELYAAVLARQTLATDARRPIGLYIDEPKLLASIPVPLDSMFELFRGMNVGITMTGQAITQLPKTVQAAALTNASTLVVFRQNARVDAELLARQLPGVSAEQLLHVDKFSAVMRLGLGDGEVAPPVTGTTCPCQHGSPTPQLFANTRRSGSGAAWPRLTRHCSSVTTVDRRSPKRRTSRPVPALPDAAGGRHELACAESPACAGRCADRIESRVAKRPPLRPSSAARADD
jgi:hypothetical protein